MEGGVVFGRGSAGPYGHYPDVRGNGAAEQLLTKIHRRSPSLETQGKGTENNFSHNCLDLSNGRFLSRLQQQFHIRVQAKASRRNQCCGFQLGKARLLERIHRFNKPRSRKIPFTNHAPSQGWM